MDDLFSAVKPLLAEHVSSGTGVLAVTFLLALLKVLLDQLKTALSDRIKEWLKSAHNLFVMLASLGVGLFLWDKQLLWSLIAFSVAVVIYFVARERYPALLAWQRLIAGAGVALFVVGVALFVDNYQRKIRFEHFYIAFLLPPDGIPKEPERVFAGLKKTLNDSLNGVDRLRVVPEKLAPEDIPKYVIGTEKLLAYHTTEGYPKVFIRNQYIALPGRAPNEVKLKMLLVPYQRRPAGNGIEPVADWKMQALVGGQEKMRPVELRSSFDLITFLASKRLVKLTPEEEQMVWRNVFAEYAAYLTLNAPKCAEDQQINKLLANPGDLTERKVRDVLYAPCTQLQEDTKADEEASHREYATQAARIMPNALE